jgi:methylmalonyl-CoA mutase cobalamin-binding subunit
MDPDSRLRVVVAAGEDEAPAVRLARRLRDAGHEVVYLTGVPSPAHLEAVAVQEDADATCSWPGGSAEPQVRGEDPDVVARLRAVASG